MSDDETKAPLPPVSPPQTCEIFANFFLSIHGFFWDMNE